jgi:type 1 glutamine amidotransferase
MLACARDDEDVEVNGQENQPAGERGGEGGSAMHGRQILIITLVLLGLSATARAEAKKKILLVSQSPDGHPAETHEYTPGLRVLAKCLQKVPDVEVTSVVATEPWKEGPDLIGRADGVVLFLAEGAKWTSANDERHKALQQLAARGGGFGVLHWAMGSREAKPIDDFLKLLGGCHGGPDRKYKVLEAEATLPDAKHPVVAGISPFRVKDEFYYRLKFVEPAGSVTPLLQVEIDGNKETVAWAWERPDKGRSFGFSGLHFHSNWRLSEYRRLVTQGVLWSVKLPVPKDGINVDVKDEDLKLK